MTEEEAKTKVCPQTFGIPEIRTADGCGVRESGPWKCIGSACMMWRLFGGYEEKTFATDVPPVPLANEGWAVHELGVYVTTYRRSRRDGYCGLAGKP